MAHSYAGKPAPNEILENIPELVSAYYTKEIDCAQAQSQVHFGTSGHRGSSLKGNFNEAHILALTQAVAEFHKDSGHTKLFLGIDTHALSLPAQKSALQVLAANEVYVCIAKDFDYTPTPVISYTILQHTFSDGIVITPSHNPPCDGGFKYNFRDGGPADVSITAHIEKRANEILLDGLKQVKKISFEKALASSFVQEYDFVTPYVKDLQNIIDMDSISQAKLKLAADAMGGAGIQYYKAIAKEYDLDIDIYHDKIDYTFSFMHCDKDGKIRMDCSSWYAMQGLIEYKDKYDLAFGNDTDFDRHGIVSKSHGLLNPNHYLSVAIDYLLNTRDFQGLCVGKTLVSSSMIDKVTHANGSKVYETPVGFKWFVKPLQQKQIFFGGEESAGASFLRKNKELWNTDKDGIILNLLAAEILAKTGKDPGEYYEQLTQKYGKPYYQRLDEPASFEQKKRLKNLELSDICFESVAGEKIEKILTHADNKAAIGGLKVLTHNAWFALRPSGTEDVYKLYAESFVSHEHLQRVLDEAKAFVSSLI